MIPWKKHEEQKVNIEKRVIVKWLEDKFHFRAYIGFANNPYLEEPNKYQESFYCLFKFEGGEIDLPEEFEWCELE